MPRFAPSCKPTPRRAASLAQAKAWQAKKFDSGFAGITWDPRWHGRGGTPIQQVIYNQEEALYVLPRGFSKSAWACACRR